MVPAVGWHFPWLGGDTHPLQPLQTLLEKKEERIDDQV